MEQLLARMPGAPVGPGPGGGGRAHGRGAHRRPSAAGSGGPGAHAPSGAQRRRYTKLPFSGQLWRVWPGAGPGGVAVKVVPGPEHLIELRRAAGLADREEGSQAEAGFIQHFANAQRQQAARRVAFTCGRPGAGGHVALSGAPARRPGRSLGDPERPNGHGGPGRALGPGGGVSAALCQRRLDRGIIRQYIKNQRAREANRAFGPNDENPDVLGGGRGAADAISWRDGAGSTVRGGESRAAATGSLLSLRDCGDFVYLFI